MESTKKQEWDWRFKFKLAVAALGLAAFFIGPFAVMAFDMIATGSMNPPALSLPKAAQLQKDRQR